VTRIAVLGMGRMGQAAAMRLVDAGHDVYVWNRTLGRTREVVDAGAHAPADLADTVAAAEIVVSVLSDDEAVRGLVFADDGGLAKLLEDRLYVDASTVSPGLCAEVAEHIDRYIALPIAGAPSTLRDGQAVLIAGGPKDLIEEARPVIDALSANHLTFARAEQAAVAKIANNNLLLVGLAALAESIAIGRAGGLTDGQLHELFDGSAMVAPGIRNRLQALLDGEGPVWWTVDLGVKDAKLALDASRAGHAALPLTVAAGERYDAAAARGLGEEDIATVGRLYAS
jgi:3-hydroxyisobutyrate dehydrogenase-like beta-hydroxyacid dehydrogenase